MERAALEQEESKLLAHLREAQRVFEEGKEAERVVLVQAMEKTMEEFRASTKAVTDERVAELIATRRDREVEFAAKEANAPPAQRAGLHDSHQEQLEGLTLNIQVRSQWWVSSALGWVARADVPTPCPPPPVTVVLSFHVSLLLQAVKERRQKTVASKQTELQAEIRDQTLIINAAISDRVRAPLRAFGRAVLGRMQRGGRWMDGSRPCCGCGLLVKCCPCVLPSCVLCATQREAMNRKVKASMSEFAVKIRLLEERWRIGASEWVAGTRRKIRSKERENALASGAGVRK